MNETKSGNIKQLTGLDRFRLTNEWVKRKRPQTKEAFIQKACEHMGIKYVPPKDYEKRRNVIVDEVPNMFPVKKKDGE